MIFGWTAPHENRLARGRSRLSTCRCKPSTSTLATWSGVLRWRMLRPSAACFRDNARYPLPQAWVNLLQQFLQRRIARARGAVDPAWKSAISFPSANNGCLLCCIGTNTRRVSGYRPAAATGRSRNKSASLTVSCRFFQRPQYRYAKRTSTAKNWRPAAPSTPEPDGYGNHRRRPSGPRFFVRRRQEQKPRRSRAVAFGLL